MSATDQSNPPSLAPREVWADLIALERPDRTAPAKPPAGGRRARQAALLVAPVLVAWLAINRLPATFVSETSFLLRHQAEPLALPATGADLAAVAGDAGSADGWAVKDYLQSRDAMLASGSVFAGNDADARYRDFAQRVAVDYETSSGVITIRAEAGSAVAARDLAGALRHAAEGLVQRFDRASGAAEYLAPLAEPNLPAAPARQNRPLVMLGALAVGLLLAARQRA